MSGSSKLVKLCYGFSNIEGFLFCSQPHLVLQGVAGFSANNLFRTFALLFINKIDFKGLSGWWRAVWEAPCRIWVLESPLQPQHLYHEPVLMIIWVPKCPRTFSLLEMISFTILSQRRMASQVGGVCSDSHSLLFQLILFSL